MFGYFTCWKCKGEFPKGWNDVEAEAEYTKLWGPHMGEERHLLCDVCDKKFKKWLKINKGKYAF